MQSVEEYFKTKSPTYPDGTPFLGYNVPAAQTFTSFSPSSDVEEHLNVVTGKSGWEKRLHLQSKTGFDMVKSMSDEKLKKSLKSYTTPHYHFIDVCKKNSICKIGGTCTIYNDNIFGPQQGPFCPDSSQKEMYLRQFTNYFNVDLK